MTENPCPRLWEPPPRARLYEPPLDDDDEDDSTCSIDDHAYDSVAGYAVFFMCLVLGASIAALLWLVTAPFVP